MPLFRSVSPIVLRALAVLGSCILLLCGAPARAASEGALAARPAPTLDAMQKELEAYRGVAPEDVQGTRLKELYASAVQALRDADVQREEQARFERLYTEAPGRAARANAELQDVPRARSAASLARGAGVARLERLLNEERTRLEDLRVHETELSTTLANLQQRVDASRAELKGLNDSAVAAGAAPAGKPGESALLFSARTDEWRARQELRAATRARLEVEARTLPARIAAVQAQLKLATAQREQAERSVEEMLGMEHLRRINEADRLRDEVDARIAALGATGVPELDALAAEVGTLASEYVDVVTRFESGSTETANVRQAYGELKASYESTRRQIDIAALSDALGPVLVEHYRKLAVLEQPDGKQAELSGLLSRARLREFQVSQLHQESPALRERVEQAVGGGAAGVPANRGLRDDAASLLADRDTLLEAMGTVYTQIATQIVELDDLYSEQAQLAQRFRVLLDRNLVWMRSHPPLGFADLLAWPGATVQMIARQDWSGLARDLSAAVSGRPFSVALFVALALVVLHQQVRLRQTLAVLGLGKVGWMNYRFVQALQALGIHLLLALPVPLLLLWAGWALEDGSVASAQDFPPGGPPANLLSMAVGNAAWKTGLLAYVYLFLLEVLGPEGFARSHLRWRAARVQSVARWLRALLWTMLPLTFFALLLRWLAPTPEFAVARIAALLGSATFLGLAVAVVREGRGMFDAAFFAQGYPWLARLGRMMVVVVLGLQVAVIVLDVQGYHFTASALQYRAVLTLVLLVIAKLVIDTGLLGLAVASRHTQVAREEETAEGTDTEAEIDIDFDKMNASAVALLHVIAIGAAGLALAALWSQFFTALEILDSFALWSYDTTVDGKDVQETVSLFDLLGALLVLGVGLVLAKGLPALLGIVLYSFITRKGVLFAIQTVLSYVVGTLGVMVALQMLGFGWSKLQWMAAGLSVGLGFGLQEIFANFFAGLIMLFERPVRIGDVVTIGEFSGTIQRIRMRATTITDFDNREIIVPNKMFVTERLINWTLSSGVVRLSFDVGVSYSADPRLVRDTLLAVLAEDARVLKDPPPNVIFREFGASSLNFRCYAHVEDVALRFPVQNDLHMRITEVFREKGIEIAYPQMDLHVRTVDPAARDALGGEGH